VDWTKSFVKFAIAGTVDTPQYSFLFDFAYEWLPFGAYGKYVTNMNNRFAAGILQ
jgi:hypothetical protein